MTNNHCPKVPARIHKTRAVEIKIAELAELIQDKISGFAEDLSMDEMLILDPRIADSWNECTRCESMICDIQGKAYDYIVVTIMNYLKEEFTG